MIFGVRDQRVKERLLRDGDQSLAKVLDACRAAESSKQQLQAMTAAQTPQVNTINKGARPKNRKSKATNHNEGGNMKQNCGFCGQNHKRLANAQRGVQRAQSATEETILPRYARKKNQVKARTSQSELLTRNSTTVSTVWTQKARRKVCSLAHAS